MTGAPGWSEQRGLLGVHWLVSLLNVEDVHTPTVGTPERAQPVHRPRGHLYFLDGHPLTVTGPARFGSGEGLTGERLGSSGGEQRRGRGSAAFTLSRSQADCLGGHGPGFPDDVTALVVGVAGKGVRGGGEDEDVAHWFLLCPWCLEVSAEVRRRAGHGTSSRQRLHTG